MSKHIRWKCASSKRPKSKLGLPDLDHSKVVVLESLRSPESKRGYQHAIEEFIQWYCSEPRLSFNKVVVTVTEFPSKIAALRLEPSMAGSRPFVDWPMRLRMPVCLVLNSPPVFAG